MQNSVFTDHQMLHKVILQKKKIHPIIYSNNLEAQVMHWTSTVLVFLLHLLVPAVALCF